MMVLEIYREERDDLTSIVRAKLGGGCLSIEGHDMGSFVEEFIGSDEYEYVTSLDYNNTELFFAVLGISELSDAEKLTYIKEHFRNDEMCGSIKKFCDDHKIKTKFWSWP